MAGVTVEFKGGAAIEKKLAEIARKVGRRETLKVGFLADATYSSGVDELRKTGQKFTAKQKQRQAKAAASGLHVAQVAFWNEYGTKNTPARPFFRNTIEAKGPTWGRAFGKNLVATNYNAEQSLARLGRGIQTQIREAINQWPADNAPATVAQKEFNKGLIDTSVMLRSVDFQVTNGS